MHQCVDFNKNLGFLGLSYLFLKKGKNKVSFHTSQGFMKIKRHHLQFHFQNCKLLYKPNKILLTCVLNNLLLFKISTNVLIVLFSLTSFKFNMISRYPFLINDMDTLEKLENNQKDYDNLFESQTPLTTLIKYI